MRAPPKISYMTVGLEAIPSPILSVTLQKLISCYSDSISARQGEVAMESRGAIGNVFLRSSRGVLCALIATLASGCASVVYKDSASTFTAAGRTASELVADSSKRLDKAQDKIREVRINKDVSCSIADERLFVRTDKSAPTIVNTALNRFPIPAALPGCQKLQRCEQAATGPVGAISAECRTVCYSSFEGNCFSQLEKSYAIELNSKRGTANPVDPVLEKEASAFALLLDSIEFQRSSSVESKLVGFGIRGLTEYLDLLEKISEERTSEVPDDAKKLSDKLSSVSKKLTDAKGEQLSDASKKTQEKVQGAIGAIGKLAGTLQAMAKNSQDATEIKRLVRENQVDVEGLISSLRSIATGDNLVALIYGDQATMAVRKMLQDQYSKTTDPYSRSLLLAERDNYKYIDGDVVVKSVDEVFNSLSKAHNSLVSLVNNPTDEQKKAIANEQFENFKTVVKDIAEVVNTVK